MYPWHRHFFLSKKTSHKRNISDRMMDKFQLWYLPVIKAAMNHKRMVATTAVVLFIASIFLFNTLGGEFIPQLDEGDFAVETRVLTGSSIDQIIDASTKAQKIMLAQFPEVKQVVNKIGSGEIPTDPMPIEAGDMMVILKDKSEWTSASSREELAEKMQEALSVIPGVTFGFQQPIQMRFNEFITGAKQDVVIKLYGEDLDVLSDEADRIGRLIKPVSGVLDLYVEEITGLPQIQIKYNRDKIAQYGLNIAEINQTIKTAFAGETAGLVYEGERRFDLVVRLTKEDRRSLADVQGLYIATPSNGQIPLEEVATVALKNGPNQIQRDDAKRRITIGFNVRNRDVQTIVSEIQQKLNKVKFPAGYYVTYGGQFENLRAANKRLSIAVPVALLLILLLLYFTFSSIRETLLIFTAIPLSAIGGVLALAIRGMPFSISAGVGFIALFGVAVLNGIVLIGEFNRLEKEGMHDIYQRVLAGTKTRLRPVLMTAAVASLGFLPMALSGSSGAEVQRPLATVVIGGLLSATLLTLIVLPILYILFERKKKPGGSKSAASPVVLLLLLAGLFLPSTSAAQTDSSSTPRQLTLQQALDEAKQNSSYLKAGRYEVDFQKSLKSGTLNLEATISYQQGQLNSINRDNYFNITQKIEFPTVYSSQSVLATAKVESTERQFRVRESELKRNVKAVYYRLQYLLEKKNLLLFEDSLYQRLAKSSKIRYQSGESTRLELVTSETQLQEIKNSFVQNEGDIEISQQQLQTLLNSKSSVSVYNQKLGKSSLPTVGDSLNIALNPYLNYLKQDVLVRQKETDVQKAKRLPDFTFGYFNQSITGLQNVTGTEQNFTRRDRFMGFQAGIAVPILPGGYRAKINASKISELIATENVNYEQNNLEGNLNQLIRQYNKSGSTIDYYQNSALKQADLIIKNAELGFKGGEISYIQFIQSMSMALKIKSDYLDQLYSQQKIVLDVEALLGDK